MVKNNKNNNMSFTTPKTSNVSNRTYRYLNRTIKKTNNENNNNTKFIKELNLALNYYIEYSINSYNYNNYLIDNYNILLNNYTQLCNYINEILPIDEDILATNQ